MAAPAIGFYDSEGIWHAGYTDVETRFADHLEKISLSVKDRFLSALGAWVQSSPAIATGTGAIASSTRVLRHRTIAKMCHFSLTITLTNNGTGATSILITLPHAAIANAAFFGVNASTGVTLQAIVSAGGTTLTIRTAAAAYPGATGNLLVINGAYEVA